MKFTFKTDKPTGKWKSFEHAFHHIKLKGVKVGSIDDVAPFTIRFQVDKADINEDGNPNCSLKWIRLRKQSTSLQEAKEFVNRGCDEILVRYKIHLEEK
jgi:hypothetical protein